MARRVVQRQSCAEPLELRLLLSATLIRDVNIAPTSFTEYSFDEVNGALLFAGPGGKRIYRSDGTPAGTALLHDIQTYGATAVVEDTFFFRATTPDGGTELWKSDGAPGGLARVADIIPGPQGSDPFALTNVGGTLYFVARDLEHDRALWKSDGTDAGTTLVHDLPDDLSLSMPGIVEVADSVYFVTEDYLTDTRTLFRTDGTPAGTILVRTFADSDSGYQPIRLVPLGNQLLFVAADGLGQPEQVWVSDGSPEGTVPLTGPGVPGLDEVSSPSALTRAGGSVYFAATTPAHGTELWKTDGTASGTVIVKDSVPGPGGSRPAEIVDANGVLFFRASDRDGGGLWRTDGTAAGTSLVKRQWFTTRVVGRFAVLRFADLNGTIALEERRNRGRDVGGADVRLGPGIHGALPRGRRVHRKRWSAHPRPLVQRRHLRGDHEADGF
jgi:ELWxxDGT repeat protein